MSVLKLNKKGSQRLSRPTYPTKARNADPGVAGAFGKRLFTLMRVESCGYMHTATSQLVPTRKCRIVRALIQGWSNWAFIRVLGELLEP